MVARVTNKGYRWGRLTENIFGDRDLKPKRTVQGWIDSPNHNGNMLTCDYVDGGVGYPFSDGIDYKF